MSNISVMLSTTGHTVKCDLPLDLMKKTNVPVCVAEMAVAAFGFTGDLEPFEHHMAQLCKGMAKTVRIDSKARSVFIGEDPEKLDTGLVDYIDDVASPIVDDFFKRWDEIHALLFEFVIFGQSGNERFALKGFWQKDRWCSLEIVPSQSIKTIPSRGEIL